MQFCLILEWDNAGPALEVFDDEFPISLAVILTVLKRRKTFTFLARKNGEVKCYHYTIYTRIFSIWIACVVEQLLFAFAYPSRKVLLANAFESSSVLF